MKVTIGDLYDVLGKRITENGDWYRDMIITRIDGISYYGFTSHLKPEDNLMHFRIMAVSKNKDLMTLIDDVSIAKEANNVT